MSSNRPYSPKDALRRVTRSMNRVVRDNTPQTNRPLDLTTTTGPIPCAVLLRTFIEGGPVPDDFSALPKNTTAIQQHVRPDGAKFIGAFELQGDKTSLVLVYGPQTLDIISAERVATMERPALMARHEQFLLGPFARSAAPTPTNDVTS